MSINDKSYFLGVDVGGTKCALVISNRELVVKERIEFATNVSRGPDVIIEQMLSIANQLVAKYELTNLLSIGISCGGPLDSKNGVILSPPNLPGWNKIHIVDVFKQQFNVTTSLQNDANAGALAEWILGAGQGSQNVIFLTFGTGLGAGLILDGKLYAGTNDLAGELGHWRLSDDGPTAFGKQGSFEAFCSGSGIAQLAKAKVKQCFDQKIPVNFCRDINDIETLTTKDIAVAAQNGDQLAISIFAESGRMLGKGLSFLIDLLNPEKIIIGSVFTRCQSFIHPHAQKIIEQEALAQASKVCEILPAQLGDSIGDLASLCIAQYAFNNKNK